MVRWPLITNIATTPKKKRSNHLSVHQRLILYVLASFPGYFEGQWWSWSSASSPETGQSPVSAPKGSETGLKLPLTAHHLRLYASSGIVTTIHCFGIAGEICTLIGPLRNTLPLTISDSKFCSCPTDSFLVNFLMPVFSRNHAHKKTSKTLQLPKRRPRKSAQARGARTPTVNGNNQGINSNPH